MDPATEDLAAGFRLEGRLVLPREGKIIGSSGEFIVEPKLMELLVFLARNAGKTLSRQEIFDAVWIDSFVSDAALYKSISNLRRTLEDDPQHPRIITTVPKRGYRLNATVVPIAGVDRAGQTAAEPHPSHKTAGTVSADSSVTEGEEPRRGVVEEHPSSPLPASSRRNRAIFIGTTIGASILISALLLGLMNVGDSAADRSSDRPLVKFVIQPPENEVLALGASYDLAISADGRKIVYRVIEEGVPRLFLRLLDEIKSRPLPGTEGADSFPFFSPDGESVGFAANGKLKKVSFSGHPPQVICDLVGAFRGGAWISGETIVFAAGGLIDPSSGLYRVPAAGGFPQKLIQAEKNHVFSCPKPLPGGKAILLDFDSHLPDGEVRAVSLKTLEQTVIVGNARGAYYLPTGQLFFSRLKDDGGILRAIHFDLDTLQTRGDPVPVSVAGLDDSDAVLSNSGTLAFIPGSGKFTRTLVWVDRQGREEALPIAPGPYAGAVLSPDGKRVALADRLNGDLWVFDLLRETMTRVTFGSIHAGSPVWTTDGKRLIYGAEVDGAWWNLFSKAADGTGSPERLTTAPINQAPRSFSGDGSVVFDEWDLSEGIDDIKVISRAGTRLPKPFLQTSFGEWFGTVSPDGRWLAYLSDETGRPALYVRPLPNLESAKWQVSPDVVTPPLWGPQGSELFYLRNRKMMVVPFQIEPEFHLGEARVLFDARSYMSFSVSPDGRRFLALRKPPQARREIHVILNWAEQLHPLLPEE